MPTGRRRGRLAVALAGVVAARAALRAVEAAPVAADWHRTNFRGHRISLAGGPALAVAATTVSAAAAAGAEPAGGAGRVAAAAALAGFSAGLVGGYDDVVGARPEQKAAKGFRGHLLALRAGRVTSGLVKIGGVGAAGLGAAALLDAADGAGAARHGAGARRGVLGRATDVLLGAGVIAGTANLMNLLDLRPGRALKAGVLVAAPLATGRGPAAGIAAGTLGAAAALLPTDLDERIMLGDSGANALGALLGTALAARYGRPGRAAVLTVVVALTAASEKVSFTRVIARTPVLRELDALGRRAG